MKKNKGITLIALVITIIVLLILAGVTIVSLSGDNGILTRAADAKDRTRREDIQEQLNLWKTEKSMEENIGGEAMKIENFVLKLKNDKTITEEEYNEINETHKLTIGKQEPIIFLYQESSNPELKAGAVVPERSVYSTLARYSYNSGERMPVSATEGDTFTTRDYIYEYHENDHQSNFWMKGWNLRKVQSRQRTEYAEIYGQINGEPVTSIDSTFYNCGNMITSPKIPESVINMNHTFYGCKSLKGDVIINARNLTNTDGCFEDCAQDESHAIVLKGICPQLETLKNTCSGYISIGN